MDLRKLLTPKGQLSEFPGSQTLGKGNGPTVLITAGMDGDEVDGIAAAYSLLQDPELRAYPGTIHIIPVVNREGFLSGVSFNPDDTKYPKNIFPGSLRGSESELLIASLWHTYGIGASLWLDLHGGATNEHLLPYIQGHETKNLGLMKERDSLLKTLHFPRTVLGHWSKVDEIEKHNCLYMLFEAGERGVFHDSAQQLHVDWVKQSLRWSLGERKNEPLTVLRHRHYYTMTGDGWWIPHEVAEHLTAGAYIGIEKRFDGKEEKIIAEKNGILLWQHVGSFGRKGTTACVVCEEATTV